jgi:protoheme ferro-lyase
MDWMVWLLPPALAFLTGVLLVNYLTVHPLVMSRYLFLTTLAWVGLVAVLARSEFPGSLLLAAGLALAAFVAGYALMTRIFLARDDPRQVPSLTRTKSDPGQGHTAVIYFTHGEPPTYDPIGWINQFREFDEQHIPFVPFLIRPIFAYQLRKHYLIVGKSGHRAMHTRMLHSLEQQFRQAGDISTRFYLSFLDDDPRPDAAVIQALNDGASRIIVAEVFLSISNHTAEGKHLIEALDIDDFGIPIVYTGPLYDSELLKQMFVVRAEAHLNGVPKSKTGILLVGHGQPDEWDVEWPTETEHELGFRRAVLDRLAEAGFARDNLDLAWMEFKQPKPAAAVARLLQNGVERILYFSAAISADAMHSQYDVPAMINQAKLRPGVTAANLGAWNDDPLVIAAIKEKIDCAGMPHFDPNTGLHTRQEERPVLSGPSA